MKAGRNVNQDNRNSYNRLTRDIKKDKSQRNDNMTPTRQHDTVKSATHNSVDTIKTWWQLLHRCDTGSATTITLQKIAADI